MTVEKLGRPGVVRLATLNDARSSVRAQWAAIPDAVFVIDRSRRIEDLNAVASALVGYEHDELCGRAIERVLSGLNIQGDEHHPDDDRVRFVSASAGAHAHHRSGEVIAVDVLLCPHAEGSTFAVVRPFGDLRERLREDDIAQIVHDLKSPLATIALETALLDHRLDDLDHTALHRAVDRITNNVDFLDRMVHDLLDLCALDSGHFTLHRMTTDLGSLVEQVVERVVSTRDRHRVRVEAAHQALLPLDELRIERVVANLVQNALKFTPADGGIVVKLDVYREHACVSIIDQGPGIDECELGTLFEKYRRARSGAKHEGSGLGLFVSKKIVEAHGGRIGVESTRGTGSRFFFELPFA